jgi:hypothetical protein
LIKAAIRKERKEERKKREILLRDGRREEALLTRAVDFQHMWEAS